MIKQAFIFLVVIVMFMFVPPMAAAEQNLVPASPDGNLSLIPLNTDSNGTASAQNIDSRVRSYPYGSGEPEYFVGTAAGEGPEINWQKCLGGSLSDFGYSISQTTDGGYIVAGETYSTDGDVSGSHGECDVWVVKLDSSGALLWQRCLGGSDDDYGYSISQTTDGGYIVGGETYSTDGDVSGNHGSSDMWVVKLDSSGALLWQKCLGGSTTDEGYSISQTTDGGYIVTGYTDSNDGDVSGNHGNRDMWVVKLDSSGALLWQKCLGGSYDDDGYSISQTTDGGYIVTGYTYSTSGDVSYPDDVWVVKLDSSGALLWQKCLGGSLSDYGYSISQTTDGGYIVTGYTRSNDGDVSGNHGEYDVWVVKLDSSGALLWQKCLGGSGFDYGCSISQTTDGGYIVTGYTDSTDGDVSGNHGNDDMWVVKLDSSGALLWQKCLGGSYYDKGHSISQTTDGGYIVTGYTISYDGDVSGNHGGYDLWVVKLGGSEAPETLSVKFSADPINGTAPLTVQFSDLSTGNPESWHWDFGDGKTSSARHPGHTYTSAGTYDVSLTVTNAYYSNKTTKTGYITVRTPTPATELPEHSLYIGDTAVSINYLIGHPGDAQTLVNQLIGRQSLTLVDLWYRINDGSVQNIMTGQSAGEDEKQAIQATLETYIDKDGGASELKGK